MARFPRVEIDNAIPLVQTNLRDGLGLLAANHSGTTAPIDPYMGQTWFDENQHVLKVWHGTSWQGAGIAAEATTITIAAGDLDITNTSVVAAAESGTADVIDTITAGTGVSLHAGMVVFLRADSGDTIVLGNAGNISLQAPIILGGSRVAALLWSGSAWLPVAIPQFVQATVANAQTFTSTTPADITGLSFAVLSGYTYHVVGTIVAASSSATVGPRFLAYFAGSVSFARNEFRGAEGAPTGPAGDPQNIVALVTNDMTTSGAFTVPAKAASNTYGHYIITSLFKPTADGTVYFRAGIESGSATVTVGPGSFAQIRVVA